LLSDQRSLIRDLATRVAAIAASDENAQVKQSCKQLQGFLR
jgi:hypothetical protein